MIVDSLVRRSLRVKKTKRGFKTTTCPHKNCLACDNELPTISPSIIKNLGAAFCKIEESKLSLEALKKKKTKAKSVIGAKAQKDKSMQAPGDLINSMKSKPKKKSKEEAEASEMQQPKKKEGKQVKNVKGTNKKPSK